MTTCPHCGRELKTVSRHIGTQQFSVDEFCDCEGAIKEREGRRVVERNRAKLSAASGAVKRSGMPDRFWAIPRDDAGLAALEEAGFSMYLYGSVGTGKTYRACAVAKAWALKHTITYGGGEYFAKPFRFRSVPSLLQDLRNCFDGHGNQAAITGDLINARLLILDDMGQEAPTDWALDRIWDIIDQRWGRRRLTIVTSQCSPAQLAQHLASRGKLKTAQSVASRLCGDESEILRFDGPDLRASNS